MEKDSFEHRISTLQVELDSCMKDIVNHISSLYAPENIPINLRNDPRNAVKILQHDVLDVLHSAQERANYSESFANDIENCQSMMDIIEKVSVASEKITKCDDAITNGTELLIACRLLEEVNIALCALPEVNTDIGTGVVCSVLRKESRMLKSRFHSKLRRLLSNCIICEYGRVNIIKRLKGMIHGCGEDIYLEDGKYIELSEIWACLVNISINNNNDMSSINESIKGVIESIWGTLLRPLWKERKGGQTPVIISNDDHAEIYFDNMIS